MREEGLLKLFFADLLPPEDAVEILRAMRERRLDVAAQLRAMEPEAIEKERPAAADGAAGRDRVQPVVRRLVRPDGSATAGAGCRGECDLMFDALARLADGRARRIGLIAIAFFPFAGAARRLGRRTARPLRRRRPGDRGGAGQAAARGRRPAGARRHRRPRNAPVSSPATRARVAGLERELGRRHDVQSISSFYTTRSTDFVSDDRRSTYISVSLRPTGRQGMAGKPAPTSPNSSRGGRASLWAAPRSPRSRSTSRSRRT